MSDDETREKHGIRGGTESVDKLRRTLEEDEEDGEDDE